MTARALLALSAAIFAILAVAPMSAAADGLPGEGVVADPVSAPGGQVGYVTSTARRHTIVREQAVATGRTLRKLRLSGTFVVPAVAYDGSPSGLSADGRNLVLIKPRTSWPRKRTSFAVIDATTMHLRRRFSLRGDFSFDAISPNGRIAYLVQYLSPRDVTAYAVRAYDMRARRLFRAPVVDKSEPDEDMRGVPLARVSDSQGRWAYTLYDSPEHPFVHALDTSGRTAACIDLDDVGKAGGATLELRGPRDPGGPRLDVVGRGERILASIDTRSNRVIEPAAASPEDGAVEDSGTSWLPLAAPAAMLLLLLAAIRRRLHPRAA